jgi:CelD/BcsL family acetyltransferase involved in cellulose biosynthesis
MQISELTTEAAFDGLHAGWNRLAGLMDDASPFQTWEWNRFWWKHFGAGHRLRLLAFHDAGELVGIAQFHQRRLGPTRIGRTLLAPLGWEDHRRRQGITEQNELIIPAEHIDRVLIALGGWLREQRWTAALLPGMRVPIALPDQLSRRAVLVGKPNWFYSRPLPKSWEEFIAGLGKSMRDNVKYYPRLLERTGHRVELHVVDDPASVADAIRTFLDLHRARADVAAKVPHRDKFASKDRRSFLLDAAPVLAGLGRLKVGLLEVDAHIVAAQLWLEMGSTMFLYYTGYDPAWAKFSVQLVATLECLKDGMRRGMERVEFLRGGPAGVDQRNERWGSERRTRANVTLAHTPAAAKLLLRIPRVQRRLRLQGTTIGAEALGWTPAG